MTNKLVVTINSLKVPKIKKILLYEIKFLVPNYSCLQNPWLVGYSPRSPFSLFSVHNWICWTPPPPEKKFLVTPLPRLAVRPKCTNQWGRRLLPPLIYQRSFKLSSFKSRHFYPPKKFVPLFFNHNGKSSFAKVLYSLKKKRILPKILVKYSINLNFPPILFMLLSI